MTKTNLAYVEETLSSPSPDQKFTRLESVGGFEFEVQTPKEPASVSRYQDSVSLLKKSLSDAGVTPLAIIPVTWWSKLCEESGLIRFYSTHRNVEFNIPPGVKNAVDRRMMFLIRGIACFFFMTMLSIEYLLDVNGGAIAATSIFGIPGSAFLSHFITNVFERPFVKLCLTGLIDLRKCFRVTNYGTIRFKLPTPPKDFSETLMKIKSAGLLDRTFFAAEPEAFSFDVSPKDFFVNEITSYRTLKRREFMEKLADPICYLEMGNAVAIVGQFGDFPIEKEVVDRVARMMW